MTYDQKAAILRSNGWQTLWSDDYWVRVVWLNDRRINVDWAGMSTDQAFEIVMKEQSVSSRYPISPHIRALSR